MAQRCFHWTKTIDSSRGPTEKHPFSHLLWRHFPGNPDIFKVLKHRMNCAYNEYNSIYHWCVKFGLPGRAQRVPLTYFLEMNESICVLNWSDKLRNICPLLLTLTSMRDRRYTRISWKTTLPDYRIHSNT